MKHIADLRLLKYAEHLSKLKNHYEHGLFSTVIINIYEEHVRLECRCQCHDWSFQELCAAFPDYWYYGDDGEPVSKFSEPEANVVEAICDWFALDPDEFIHLFDVELSKTQSIKRYGGTKFTVDSSCSDLANNIFQLVKRRAQCIIN